MTSTANVLDDITDWAVGLMETMGGPGAGLAIAMENLFPPIPSEVILPLAGLAAGQGKMNLFSAIAWTTAGSVAGAVALYYIGMVLGRDRIVALAARLPLVKVSDIEKTEAWFNKHGGKAVFFGRFVPIFRSFISIPAGLEKMAMPKFLLYTTFGSAIWNTIFILIGFKLGENWEVVTAYVSTYSKAVVAVVVLAVALFIFLRIRSIRKERRDGGGDVNPPGAGGDAPNGGPQGPHDSGPQHLDRPTAGPRHSQGSAPQYPQAPQYRQAPGPQDPPGPSSHGDGYYRSANHGG